MQGEATARSCGRDGPPATWVEVALVMDDPDAPRGTYVHWVLFGLDPSVSELEEGELPACALQAKNSAGDARYKGPMTTLTATGARCTRSASSSPPTTEPAPATR
jgi:phosphatidylethanolamine-binding protein (PEBP) family uncharacterized protein